MSTTTCSYLEAVENGNWEYDYYCRACNMKRIGDTEDRRIVDGVCHALYEDCDAYRHPGTGQPGLRHVEVSAAPPKPEKPRPEPEEREKPRPEPEERERYEPEKRYGNAGTVSTISDVGGCLGEGMSEFRVVIGLILGVLAAVAFVLFKAREILLENDVPVRYALLLAIPLLALLIVLIGSLGKGGARLRKGAVDALATAAALSLSLYLGVYSHWALSLIVPMLMLLLLCCFAAYTRRRLEGDAADDTVQADVDRLFLLSWIVCCVTPVFAILEKTRYEKFGTYLWQTILAAVIGAGLAWLTGKMVLYMINEEWDEKAARSSAGRFLMPACLILLVCAGVMVMRFPMRDIVVPVVYDETSSYDNSLYDDSSYDNSLYDDSSYDNSLYGGSSYGSDASLIEGGTSLPAVSTDLVSLAADWDWTGVWLNEMSNGAWVSKGGCRDTKGNEYEGYLAFAVRDPNAAEPGDSLDLGGAYEDLDLTCYVAEQFCTLPTLTLARRPGEELGLRVYADGKLIADTGLLGDDREPTGLHLDVSGVQTLYLEAYGGEAPAENVCLFVVNGSVSQ